MLTSSSSIASLVSQATALSEQQTEISRELSSGTRLTQLSNDPRAAAATVRLSSSLTETASTLTAIQTVQAHLQTADSALSSAVTQLTSAVSIAVAAANDTNSGSDRSAAATQLASILSSVVGLANTSFDGTYLFGGTSASSAPYVQNSSSGDVSYTGDSGSMKLTVQGTTVQASASGTGVFGDGDRSVFASLQNIINTLQTGGAPTSDQVTEIRDALQTVIEGRSALASGASRLEALNSYTATQQTNLEAQQSTLASSDPVALAVQLSSTTSQRSALLSSLAALNKTSLFDYLSS